MNTSLPTSNTVTPVSSCNSNPLKRPNRAIDICKTEQKSPKSCVTPNPCSKKTTPLLKDRSKPITQPLRMGPALPNLENSLIVPYCSSETTSSLSNSDDSLVYSQLSSPKSDLEGSSKKLPEMLSYMDIKDLKDFKKGTILRPIATRPSFK